MKRLILCCDGTWLDSMSGLMDGKIPLPSNVTRISQAIKPIADDGVEQVVFYQAGIGSQGSLISRVISGVTAEGISDNIRTGYAFLASNYAPGDEIFFFGFSRGAFTVRTIAGMINSIGLLTKSGLQYLAEIFEDWLNARNPDYRPRLPDVPFRNKPSVSDPQYALTLRKLRYARLDVPITVIGVWDTVGALGVPRIPWLENVPFYNTPDKRLLFYDTKLNNLTMNAFQALALDEHRRAFEPAVWEKPRGNKTNLRQVWFPGAHSNVGGGYPDQGIANITLAWMMSQTRPFLSFFPDFMWRCGDDNVAYYHERGKKPRPWSFGKIYRSFTGLYMLGGRRTRHPGEYRTTENGRTAQANQPLRKTMEYVHPSVRCRKVKRGPGIDDMGVYEAEALDRYVLKTPTSETPSAVWQPRRRNGTPLYESPLWMYELEVLDENSPMTDYVLASKRSRRLNLSNIPLLAHEPG